MLSTITTSPVSSHLRYILLVTILVVPGIFSYSQEKINWDNQFENVEKLYRSQQFDQMLDLVDSLYQIADSEKEENALKRINVYRGIGNHILSIDYELAVVLLEESMNHLDDLPEEFHPEIYMYLSSAYLRAGSHLGNLIETKYQVPDSLARLALSIFRDHENVEGEIRALKELATVEIYKGDFEAALQLLIPSYEMAVETQHHSLRALVNTIAIVYSIGKRHEEAIDFVEKYYAFVDDEDLIWRDSYCFQLIGNAYNEMEDWKNAQVNYKKAIALIDGNKGREVRVWSYWPLAQSYVHTEQYDSAEYWVNEADKYYEHVNDTQMPKFMSIVRAHISTSKGDYIQAEKYIEEYADISLKMNQIHRHYNLSDARHKLYKAWGKPEKALASLEVFHHYSDSLRRTTFSKKFEDYKVRLETAKQRVDILELENELQARNNRIILISSISVILLMIAGYIVTRYQAHRKRAQKELSVKEKELADFTLSMVRKNQVMNDLNVLVDESFRKTNGDLLNSVHKMKRLLTVNKSQEDNWNQFLEHFGAVHHDFFDKLQKKYENLSPKDLRHCALLRMNLSLKESADILGVESNSVKMARYRLKKKMKLQDETDLTKVFINLN